MHREKDNVNMGAETGIRQGMPRATSQKLRERHGTELL